MNIEKRFSFIYPFPPDTDWTDKAIAGLVGQETDLTAFGQPAGRVRVIEAVRAEGEGAGRPGIWITVVPVGQH